MEYTIYVERDQMPDPQRYPDGIAYCSGVKDEHGEIIDSEGDIETFEHAKSLAMNLLDTLLTKENL